MPPSTRTHFERELAQLAEDVLRLGSMARRAITEAMRALAERDVDLAREVIAADAGINRLRFDIETECYMLIATEQPVASDLRRVVSALIVATDLERIADHGKKIARISQRMADEGAPGHLGAVPQLAELALAMLDRALRAIQTRDTAEAQAVCREDDRLDAGYRENFNALLADMLADPARIGLDTHLLQISHELERIGDRATNIAERVIYSVTGELIDLNT